MPASAGHHILGKGIGTFMIINVTYDASVANAPAGYKQAVQAAIQYFENAISTNITVNINFGWGEVGGQAVSTDAVSESQSQGFDVPYSQVLQGLASSATSAADFASLTALLAGDPTNGGTYFVTSAEAKALGLYPPASSDVDGYVGLNSAEAFTFNTSGTPVAGAYDAVGALEHEISEVLGRVSGLGQTDSNGQPLYAPLDLFRYTSAGVRDLTPGAGSFSVDGQTFLAQFNNPGKGGDAGDLANAGADAFSAFGSPGTTGTISAADLNMMDVLGYSLGWGAAPAAPATPVPGVAATAPATYSTNTALAAGQA